jgi:hypothetical protein
MSGRLGRIVLAMVAVGVGATAHAGLHDDGEVVQFYSDGDGLTVVGGNVGDTHNSANRVEFIGCQTLNAPTTRLSFCWAKDAVGTYIYCQSSSPAFAATADSIDSDSHVEIIYDASGACVQLSVDHTSESARIQ